MVKYTKGVCRVCGRMVTFLSHSGLCFHCLHKLGKIASKLAGSNWVEKEIKEGIFYDSRIKKEMIEKLFLSSKADEIKVNDFHVDSTANNNEELLIA